MKDWRGVEVVVGDPVVYATRTGSSMEMVEGIVLEVNDDRAKVKIVRRQGWGEQETVTLSNLYLTVAITPPSYTKTLQQKNEEAAAAKRAREAKQAACAHINKRHGAGWGYTYWTCEECHKYEYKDDK